MTPYGLSKVKQTELPSRSGGAVVQVREPAFAVGRPRWGRIIGFHAVGLALLAVLILHLTGGGFHHLWTFRCLASLEKSLNGRQSSSVDTRLLVLVAALDLDGDVNQFSVFAEQSSVDFHRLRVVRHDADDSGEFACAHLPNVQIGYE